MMKEKVYFEEGDVTITSSRVKIGDKTFVLRNISAVQVGVKESGRWLLLAITLITFIPIAYYLFWADIDFFGYFFLICALLSIPIYKNEKDTYYVEMLSAGIPTTILDGCESKELPERVVEAINAALLAIDNI